MDSTIIIVRQEYPPNNPKPYRLIETYPTTEGRRTRVCSGLFSTGEDAREAMLSLMQMREFG